MAAAPSSSSSSSCKVVLAGTIAKGLLEEVQASLKTLQHTPKLVGFLANSDPAARMYADWTARSCAEKYVSHAVHNV
ncbi:hypothetical protein Dda_7511 [Drechslerella dactyloides]|uniref:Uncharacterized protein n=1 Tax=Drechslerella dactyloides TaxID=74499 RepID=A0AAD6NID4_DREDA|nr:hypothetical protein Dda_7511 [Drechslerella dactyloides]